MSNTLKKVLSLVLALVMVFGSMPVQAFATETTPSSESTPAEETPASENGTDENLTPADPSDGDESPEVPGEDDPIDTPADEEIVQDPGAEGSPEEPEVPEIPAQPEVDEAVAAVQAMIDALPGAENYNTSLYSSQAEFEAALADLEIKLTAIDEAIRNFTDEQCAKLDDAKYIASWTIINGYWLSMAPMLIEWVEVNGTNYVDMLNGEYTKGQLYTVLSAKWPGAISSIAYKGYYYGNKWTNTTKANDSALADLTDNKSYTVWKTTKSGYLAEQTEVGSFTARTYYKVVVSISGTTAGSVTYNGTTYKNGDEIKYYPSFGKEIVVNDVSGWNTPAISQPSTSGTLTVEYTESKANDSTIKLGTIASDVTVTVNGNPVGEVVIVEAGSNVTVAAAYTGSSKNTYISSLTVMDGTTNAGASFTAGEGKEYVINVATDTAIKLSATSINYNTSMSATEAEAAIKALVKSIAGNNSGEITVKYWHEVTLSKGWTALSESSNGIAGAGAWSFGDAASEKVQISSGNYVWEGDIALTDTRDNASIQVRSAEAFYYTKMDAHQAKETIFNAIYVSSTPALTAKDVTIEVQVYGNLWTDITGEVGGFKAIDLLKELGEVKAKIIFGGNIKYKPITSSEVNVKLVDNRTEVTIASTAITVSYQSETILEDMITAIGASYSGVSYLYSDLLVANDPVTAEALKAAAIASKGNTLEVTVKLGEGNTQYKPVEKKVTVSFSDAWYTVSWKNDNGDEIDTTDALFGTTPTHDPIDKNPTAQYTYSFNAWEAVSGVENGVITGNAVYKATFDRTVNKYLVTFVDEDGTELQTGKVEYGTTPNYEGKTPEKAADAQYTYTFAAWDQEIIPVTGEITYTATYSKTLNEYEIVFKSHDSEEADMVKYGEVPTYETPSDYEEGDKYYTFKGWNPEVVAVTGPATYEAVYTDAQIHKVTFDTNGGVMTEDNIKRVIYGETVTEIAVSRDGYRFDGWYLDGAEYDFTTPVTGDITLTAKWVKLVTVTFDVEGDAYADQIFDIGGKAEKPADPTKDQAIFGGWYLNGAQAENPYDFSAPVEKDTNLVALWLEDLNRNGVEDAKETITITITKADDADNVTITGSLMEKSLGTPNTTTYIFDSTKPAITIVATPVVNDGKCATYVSGIEGTNGTGEYKNYVYTYTFDAADGNAVTVNFAKAAFTFNDERLMSYYAGMKNVAQKDLYDIIASAPAYEEADEITVTYMAREAMTHKISIDSLDFGDGWMASIAKTALKEATIDGIIEDGNILIKMDPLWLPVDVENKAPFPESIPLDLAVQKYLNAEMLSGLIEDLISDILAGNWNTIGDRFTQAFAPVYEAAMYYDAHRFGYNPDGTEVITEEIKLTYRSAAMYIEGETTVDLKDTRTITQLTGSNVTLTYRDYTDADLVAAINPVVTDENGVAVAGAAVTSMQISDGFTFTDKTVSDTGYEITFKFAGNETHRPCEATFVVTIAKASLSMDLPDVIVTHGNGYDAMPQYTMGNAYGNRKEIDDALIRFVIGLDVADLDIDGDGITGLTGKMQLILTDDLQEAVNTALKLIGKDPVDGIELSISELMDILSFIDNDMLGTLGQALESIQGVVEDYNLTITLGGDMPTDIGAYLYGAVATCPNYETAFDVGYILIKPNATRVYLDWNTDAPNGVFTPALLKKENLSASAYDDAAFTVKNNAASNLINNLFFGLDLNGELVTLLYNKDVTDPEELEKELSNGAYAQMAFIAEFGNEMYYAVPAVRAFVIMPDVMEVTLVGENGTANREMMKTFNGKPLGFSVKVTGADGELVYSDHYQSVVNKLGENAVTYNYVGIQTNGTVYNSSEKPVHAGAYVVTVSVEDRDANGNILAFGADAGLLVIEPTTSTVIVTDKVVEYKPDVKHYFADMVDAGSTVDGLKPDTTIISGGINTNGEFSENGWEAIGGTVNVDFPAWIDAVIAEYAPSVIDCITVGEFSQKLVNKIPDIAAKLEELGATNEMLNSMSNSITNVSKALNKMPSDVVLSFSDDAYAESVGAYVIVAVVTDSDHIPSVDAGLMIVGPDVETVKLEWNYEDPDNIWTRELLKFVDLSATAFDGDVANPEATEEITYRFLGIDQDFNLIVKTAKDADELPNGAYIELAYINLELDGKIYISDLLARELMIVPGTVEVTFKDINGNNVRHFVFDNTPKSMEVVVTNNGTAVTPADGDLTVTYIGVQTNGKTYHSTVAPTHAGAYTVVAAYVERTNSGKLANIGGAVGALIIEPAESSIDVTGFAGTDAITYDGKGHTADVEATGSGVYEPDYTLISGGVYLTDEIGVDAFNGNVNIDFPRWLDEALAEYEFTDGVNAAKLADYIRAYRETIIAQIPAEIPAESVEKINAAIDELLVILAKIPADVALTFENDVTYTEPGVYLYYGIVTDSDHYPSSDTGLLEIVPAELTVTMDNINIHIDDDIPELTWTASGLIDGDKITVNASTDADNTVAGTYTITATVSSAKYTVTVVDGILTVEDHTVVIDKASPADCENDGLTEGKHCSVCNKVLVEQEVIPALRHKDDNSDNKCDNCGAPMREGLYPIAFNSDNDTTGTIVPGAVVEIDGVPYVLDENCVAWVSNANAKLATTYAYHTGSHVHETYPSHMYVWYLSAVDKDSDGTCDVYTADAIRELDDFFMYEGTSIRINFSSNGIRFFTSVDAGKLADLMNGTLLTGKLENYKLVQAGTLYKKYTGSDSHITLETGLSSDVYGGKAGSNFRVFGTVGERNWFTGMLTGLDGNPETLDMDIQSRPFAVLELNGEQVVLYGGTVQRSIYYVATQNRDYWAPGTVYDNIIENLIATVEEAREKP